MIEPEVDHPNKDTRVAMYFKTLIELGSKRAVHKFAIITIIWTNDVIKPERVLCATQIVFVGQERLLA